MFLVACGGHENGRPLPTPARGQDLPDSADTAQNTPLHLSPSPNIPAIQHYSPRDGRAPNARLASPRLLHRALRTPTPRPMSCVTLPLSSSSYRPQREANHRGRCELCAVALASRSCSARGRKFSTKTAAIGSFLVLLRALRPVESRAGTRAPPPPLARSPRAPWVERRRGGEHAIRDRGRRVSRDRRSWPVRRRRVDRDARRHPTNRPRACPRPCRWRRREVPRNLGGEGEEVREARDRGPARLPTRVVVVARHRERSAPMAERSSRSPRAARAEGRTRRVTCSRFVSHVNATPEAWSVREASPRSQARQARTRARERMPFSRCRCFETRFPRRREKDSH